MTYEEYCEIMDNSNFLIDSANPYDVEIKEALEKQIPKKPNYEHCTEMYACCPSCGLFLSRKAKHLYCSECGQRIDWTEESEEA